MQRVIVVACDTSSSTRRWIATIETRCRGVLAINAVMNRIQLICCLIMRRTRNVFRWWIWNGNFDFLMFSRTKSWKAFGWGTAKACRRAIRTPIIAVGRVVIIRPTATMYSQCQSLLLESISYSFWAFFHHFSLFKDFFFGGSGKRLFCLGNLCSKSLVLTNKRQKNVTSSLFKYFFLACKQKKNNEKNCRKEQNENIKISSLFVFTLKQIRKKYENELRSMEEKCRLQTYWLVNKNFIHAFHANKPRIAMNEWLLLETLRA